MLTLETVCLYAAFSVLHCYATNHIATYKGQSQGFLAIMNTVVFSGTLGRYGYLIAYGYYRSVLGTLLLLALGFAVAAFVGFLESKSRRVHHLLFSLIALPGIPLILYYLVSRL